FCFLLYTSLLLLSCRPFLSFFFFFFYCYAAHRALHSFPTRRSSDLMAERRSASETAPRRANRGPSAGRAWGRPRLVRATCTPARSEEHTSELQSRFDLVCRLLLEKKKKKKKTKNR